MAERYSIEAELSAVDKGYSKALDVAKESVERLTNSIGNMPKISKSTTKSLDNLRNSLGKISGNIDNTNEAFNAYSKMISNGEVDQKSWNTLLDNSGNTLDELASKLLGAGNNQKDLFEGMKSGKVSMNDFESGLDLLGGSMGNFTDGTNLGISAVSALSSVISGTILSGMNALSDAINNIKISADGAVNAISSIGNATSKVSRSSQSILSKLYGSIGKPGKQSSGGFKSMFAGITAGNLVSKGISSITGSLDGAIDRLDTLEQFPKVMESWGYSTDKARKSSDKLVKGIDGLPTKLNDIVSNVQQIVTSGLELDEATELALALNNAFLANGSSSAEAERGMHQYNKMIASGKVDMMSWNSLVNTAGKALDDVAKKLIGANANQADLYEALGEDGPLAVSDLNRAMIELNNTVGGFAEQAMIGSEGVATSIQNVKTAVANATAGVIDSFDELLRQRGFGSLSSIITDLKKPILEFGKIVESVLPKVLDGILFVIDKLKRLTTVDIVGMIALPKAIRGMATFGQGILNVTSKMTDLSDKSAGAFNKVGKVVGKASNKVSGLLAKIGNIGTTITTAIGGAITGLGVLLGPLTGGISTIIGAVLGPIAGLAGQAMKAVMAVAGLSLKVFGAYAKVLMATFGTITQGLVSITTFALNTIGPTAIFGLFIGALGYVNKEYGNIISKLEQKISNDLPNIINKTVNTIISKIESLIPAGVDLITRLSNVIVKHGPHLVEAIVTVVESLVYTILDSKKQIFDAFVGVFGTIIDAIGNYTFEFIDIGLEVLANIITGLTDNDFIYNGITNFINKLKQSFLDNEDSIRNNGILIIQGIISGMVQAIQALSEVVHDMLLSLAHYIEENKDALVTSAVSILHNIARFILDNLDLLLDVGLGIMESINEGIKNNKDYVKGAMIDIVIRMKEMILAYAPRILEIGQEIIGFVTDTIGEHVDDIKEAATEILDTLGITLAGQHGIFADIGELIVKGIGWGIVRAFKGLASSLAGKVKSLFGFGNAGDEGKKDGQDYAKNYRNEFIKRQNERNRKITQRSNRTPSRSRGRNRPTIDRNAGVFKPSTISEVVDDLKKANNIGKELNETLNQGDSFGLDDALKQSEKVAEAKVDHEVSSMPEVAQPAYISLQMGSKTYRTFVEDINSEQGNIDILEREY